MSGEKGYAERLFDLSGRVVLVTGGSRGLGREMAFAAARCGADVMIASRKYNACVDTADEIAAQTGRTAFPYQVHVGRWDELDGLVDAVYDRFGRSTFWSTTRVCHRSTTSSPTSPRSCSTLWSTSTSKAPSGCRR